MKFIEIAKTLNDNFASLGPRYIEANKKSLIQSNPEVEIAEMKFISGACMFFRKKTFDLIGGFDENFFLYFEETDFCLRASKIKKNFQINTIKIRHNVGTSVQYENHDKKEKLKDLYNWHFIWSKFYYFKKNYGFYFSLIYFFPIILKTLFKIFINYLSKNRSNEKKYRIRLNGLISSIKGQKSHKRID